MKQKTKVKRSLLKNKQMVIIPMLLTLIVFAPIFSSAEHGKNKAEEWCEGSYNGKWKDGECIIKDEDTKAEYEDDVCDNPQKSKKIKKLCGYD